MRRAPLELLIFSWRDLTSYNHTTTQNEESSIGASHFLIKGLYKLQPYFYSK
jgi:hypothetical protein